MAKSVKKLAKTKVKKPVAKQSKSPKKAPEKILNSPETSRINRIIGQLKGVSRMIDEKKECPEVLIQLKAIRAAVKSLESNLIISHLQSSSSAAIKLTNQKQRDQKIEEIINIFRRYE